MVYFLINRKGGSVDESKIALTKASGMCGEPPYCFISQNQDPIYDTLAYPEKAKGIYDSILGATIKIILTICIE